MTSIGLMQTGFTLADALLGIETGEKMESRSGVARFTLADALLGIETRAVTSHSRSCLVVSLWLMPF